MCAGSEGAASPYISWHGTGITQQMRYMGTGAGTTKAGTQNHTNMCSNSIVIFSKILTLDIHSSPNRVKYGMSIVNLNSAFCFISVIAILYLISRYISANIIMVPNCIMIFVWCFCELRHTFCVQMCIGKRGAIQVIEQFGSALTSIEPQALTHRCPHTLHTESQLT